MSVPAAVHIGDSGLGREEVVRVARHGVPAAITAEADSAMRAARRLVEEIGAGSTPAYGISTGFGLLANTAIPVDQRSQLQHALIRSHAAGMGPRVEVEVVRAMMLLRARTLCLGYSGSRPEVAHQLVALLNSGITPVVPEHGSLGASGDLAPLAHMSLVLIGEGRAELADGRIVDGAQALREAGLQPIQLEVKDGLSLINGTDGMLGMLVLAIEDLETLLATADISAALSTEALLGTDGPFIAELHQIRPHPGQMRSAENLIHLLDG